MEGERRREKQKKGTNFFQFPKTRLEIEDALLLPKVVHFKSAALSAKSVQRSAKVCSAAGKSLHFHLGHVRDIRFSLSISTAFALFE